MTAGAATLGFPSVLKAQGPISMRWQSTWPTKDIFHEYALDFAKKVNDMTGGDLKIEVLPAGAVVPAFDLLNAVSKGTLDGGHGVFVYHYGKNNALSLWGSSPAYGMDADMLLSWHKYGGGKELFQKVYDAIGVSVKSYAYGPMWTQPLGWFKKPITKADDFKGLKFRTVGISIDLFKGMGAAVNALPGGEIVPALDRGLLDGAEFNNASSDRLLGFADVSKVCMLQSYHQSAESFEILFNKTKFDALPDKMKAIIDNAVEAASADVTWKSIDRYSKDYIELQTKDKVKFYKTPDSILQKELDIFDKVEEEYSAKNPLFKEIAASQRKFAERTVKWKRDYVVSPTLAYNHYFGKKAAPAKPLPRRLHPQRKNRRKSNGVWQITDQPPGQLPGWLIFGTECDYAEIAVNRRQDQHLRGQGLFLAHRIAHLADHLGGVLALRPRRPARLGLRRDDPDVRHALHDGGRLYALEEQHGPRRRPLRLLSAAAPGRPRPDALHRLFPPRGDRPLLGRIPLCQRFLGDPGALGHHRQRPAGLPVQDHHPPRRGVHADPGDRRDHPLHPAASRMASGPRASRTSRRSTWKN